MQNWLNALIQLLSRIGAFLLPFQYGKTNERLKQAERSIDEAIKSRKRSERNLTRSDSDARERLRKIRSK